MRYEMDDNNDLCALENVKLILWLQYDQVVEWTVRWTKTLFYWVNISDLKGLHKSNVALLTTLHVLD